MERSGSQRGRWCRAFVASAALLLGTGCVRNLRAEEAYLDTLRSDFEARVFEISLPEAKLRILALAEASPGQPCAPCVLTDACNAKECRFRFGTSLEDEACLVATEAPYGELRFKVTCGDPWRVENSIRMVWQELDGAGFAEAEGRAQGVLARRTLDEARTFSPRWAPTAGAYGVFGATHRGVGARVGVRRWHDPNFLSGLLLDYERTSFETPPAPVGPESAGHQLSLLLRAEVAPWSGWSADTRLPEASLYMLGGGSLVLDDDLRPGDGAGFRIGVGGHANRYTRSYSLPVFVEAHLSRLYFRRLEATSVRAVVGVGF